MLVGLQLIAAQNPAGHLVTGDSVQLLHAPPPGVGGGGGAGSRVLLTSVRVWSARTGDDGSTVATVVLPAEAAATVGGYAARGEVTLVRMAAADTAERADPTGTP